MFSFPSGTCGDMRRQGSLQVDLLLLLLLMKENMLKFHHTKIETTMWNSEIYLKAQYSIQEEIKPKIYFLR